MANAIVKKQCSTCNKEKSTYKCEGCSLDFCFNHLNEHRQIIQKQFDELENDHDQFKQRIIQQLNDLLIQQIDQWEEYSIEIIKQTPEQCRQKLIKYINQNIIQIENDLNNLDKQMKNVRRENDFNEMDLNHLKQKLNKLEEEL